ncbi:MAG: hypothetical protein LBD22_06320 [Spirochaetaceae bacterium]|jgi:hypothetical protein|nr:hypothetical protein [Spirochaetaceae bacterium]
MASEKAIYAPGELDKVKQRLGHVDENEARRMQKILGGEVGRERADGSQGAQAQRSKPVEPAAKKVRRTVGVATDDDETSKRAQEPKKLPTIKRGYFNRVKLDSLCGEPEFGIKTPLQVLVSKIMFFKPPADLVNPHFVRQNLNEYYKHIETLVTTVRLLLPKSNTARTQQLKKTSMTAYQIIDTFRQWKINQISTEITKLQSRPRAVYVSDFQPLLRDIYRPLFILDDLTIEIDIEDAFNALYNAIFLESPTPETEQERKKMVHAVAAYRYIKMNIHYLLYPLMLKNLSPEFIPYTLFWSTHSEKIMNFLGVSNADKVKSAAHKGLSKNQLEDKAADSAHEKTADSESDDNEKSETGLKDVPDGSTENAENKEENTEESKMTVAEKKAFEHGLAALEMLFPQAGWQNLKEFPDFYPYFSAILSFKKGCEMFSPQDPTQLALVLSAVIEEMLFGFRSIKFKDSAADTLTPVLDEWNYVFDETFYNTYLRLVDEYVAVLKSSGGNAKTNYAMALINDIFWARRYYLFPLYEYKSGMPPTFSKKDIRSMFALSRRLRNALTNIAADIDIANKAGGAKTAAACKLIENPWDNYIFEIANPISKRLDMLLPKDQRTNVNLIFFVMAAVTLLDNHLNNPASIAYTSDSKAVFRSVNNEGREPILWVDKRTDVNLIFKESLSTRKK